MGKSKGIQHHSGPYPKAHHLGHQICPCGCGTVVIILYDENANIIATGQLFPENMIEFCYEIVETSFNLIPQTSPT